MLDSDAHVYVTDTTDEFGDYMLYLDDQPGPCELLAPVLEGVMAVELANLARSLGNALPAPFARRSMNG